MLLYFHEKLTIAPVEHEFDSKYLWYLCLFPGKCCTACRACK